MTDTDLIANPAHDAATAAPRRRGGLTGMVLADLRALAAEIGVGDTAGMRKGDLIVAIKQRQSGSGAEVTKATAPATAAVQDRAPRKRTAAVREEADASSSAAPQATALLAPADAAAPAAAPPAPVSAEVVTAGSAESKSTQTDGRRPRQRRGASRAAGAVETGGGQSREAAESPKSPEATTNGASSGSTSERDAVSEPVIQPEKSTKADGGGQQREQGDRQQGGRGNSRQAGGGN
ncbi:MAG: Rho termination factor N-terminal domain-containing protein, partial [Mycobacteriaceae bacterium]